MLTDSLSVSSQFTSAASPKGQMQNNIDLREALLAHGIETSPPPPPPPPPINPCFHENRWTQNLPWVAVTCHNPRLA